jgi:hypothetical protein
VLPRDRLDAFRAGAVLRFRDAAAFLPAATRFGDFLAVVRVRLVEAFLADVVLRFLVAAALRPAVFLPAVFRFLALAAFLAAVFRVREVAALRPVVLRLRVAAAFLPAATRFGDFLVVERLRVAAAFLAAVFLERVVAPFLAAVFLERVVAAFFAAVLRLRVVAAFLAAALRVAVSLVRSIGAVGGINVVSVRGVGRSHAGMAGRDEGSGVVGASSVLRSWSVSRVSSADEVSSLSVLGRSHGQSRGLRSDIVAPSSRRGLLGPYPDERGSMHADFGPPVRDDVPRERSCWSRSSLSGP